MGCTPWQLLTRIRLRLALPEILLGLNQTIMFALSMLVITALVGTRDLGQEVYIALTKADPGLGLVAGLLGRLHRHHRRPADPGRCRAGARAAGADRRRGPCCCLTPSCRCPAGRAHRPAPAARAGCRTRSGRSRTQGPHVVRLGRDYPFHHVDRAREAMTARAAHRAGFGPEVLHTGPGVMVTAFLDTRTWGEADLREIPNGWRLLADFHTAMPAEVSGAAFLFWPFHVIRDYARTLSRHPFTRAPGRTGWTCPPGWRRHRCRFPWSSGITICCPPISSMTAARLWLIDYEYAGFGTALFDLAGVATNSGMEPRRQRCAGGDLFRPRRPNRPVVAPSTRCR
jgi:hypothetical protein